MKFVAAGQDAIDGFYVTATARLLQVVMLTAGVVAGLVSGLKIAMRLGAYIYISTDPIRYGAVPVQYIGAILAAVCFVVGGFASWRMIALAGTGAALAWFGFKAMQAMIAGDVFPDFVGAFLAAFVVTLLVRRSTIPGFALVNGSILILVPGMRLFRGLLEMVGTNYDPPAPSDGGTTLLIAVGVALAIAAGASLGMFLGRPVGDRLMGLPLEWYDNLRRRRDS